jgi:uncharacterized membrane protein YozB (DUF420 family)
LSVAALPHVNAAINTGVALLLILGFVLIKRGQREAHKKVMTAALVLSALFLVSYVVYHYGHGSTKFRGQGGIRTVYFTILLTHTVLAIVNLPLVIITVVRAWKGQFEKHRRIAKWTWVIWLYVAITGPLVYLMLYQLYPSDGGVAAFAQAQKIHRTDRKAALASYERAASDGHLGAACFAAVIRQTETSSTAVRKTLEANQSDVFCLTLLGRELVYAGKLEDAKAKLQEAVSVAPGEAFVHASLGFAQFRGYEYDEAAGSFERAIERDGTVAMYFYNAGYAHYLRGAYGKAKPLYVKAIELGLDEEIEARAKEDIGVIDGSVWVCPMHADERGGKGDHCGQCGMPLEPVSRGVPEE